jgi:alpha-tubulin suppressor-like RCC1 family protein
MARVGEVMFCSSSNKGLLSTHDYFNGKTVECIGGGYSKLFILEPSGKVTAIGSTELCESDREEIQKLGQIKSLKCGKFHTLVLVKDGFVYSFGQGMFGVLGHGGALSASSATLIKAISDKVIKEIACGEAHSLALTQQGEVYAWGRGYEGQLGIRESIETISVPKYIDTFYSKQVMNVACGQRSSFAIDIDGTLYSWGEGRCGQLGHGKERECKRPKIVDIHGRVKEIAAGAGHALALIENGEVWTWGLNNYGQLGCQNFQSTWVPVKVFKDSVGNDLEKIEKICCCAFASFALGKSGNSYSWGKGFIGHLGESIQNCPKVISINTENRSFSDVFASDLSLVLFSPLRLYSLSPSCGPAGGGTKVTIIGTALANTSKLKVRFRYGHLMSEVSCDYDSDSNSLEFFTPQFVDDEDEVQLPCEAFIDVTMDGECFVTCERKFLIYPDEIHPENLNPKCASVNGRCTLEISADLRGIQKSWLWLLTVGFLPKSRGAARTETPNRVKKEQSLDDSRTTTNPNDLRGEEHDWLMVAGKYEDGKITCKIPVPEDIDDNSSGYVVDISINGQQFSGKPLNFKFFNIEVSELKPMLGSSDAGTNIKICGKGFYDSTAKKMKITSQYGERDVAVNWDRKLKCYQCVIPPLHWLIGTEQFEAKDVKSLPLKLELTLNCIEYTLLPTFFYNDSHLLRISKAKIDETLTPQAKQDLWEKEDPEEKEEPEAKLKREQEEDQAMLTACKPGVKLFLWSEGLMKTPEIIVRFILGTSAVQVSGIFKNSKKVGVAVPDLGELLTPTEVLLDFSLNGQSFTKEQLPIKYLGASAVEEQPKRRK